MRERLVPGPYLSSSAPARVKGPGNEANRTISDIQFIATCRVAQVTGYKYKLGYVKRGSTVFKVPKDGCGVPSAARALLGPEGLLMR